MSYHLVWHLAECALPSTMIDGLMKWVSSSSYCNWHLCFISYIKCLPLARLFRWSHQSLPRLTQSQTSSCCSIRSHLEPQERFESNWQSCALIPLNTIEEDLWHDQKVDHSIPSFISFPFHTSAKFRAYQHWDRDALKVVLWWSVVRDLWRGNASRSLILH